MADQPFRFDDGAAYERLMGVWSGLAGNIFLDWLGSGPGLRWIDVGCGNGAFTELIMERCAPAEIDGIDPSGGQLAFARKRPAAQVARFHLGNAMALPFSESKFDAAVMALVIFFVPEPAKGVAEMARVVRPGGVVAAYAWDIAGGGLPFEPIFAEMRALGLTPPLPPKSEAARMDALHELWTGSGLGEVETRAIVVKRTFADFDDFWTTNMLGPGTRALVDAMSPSNAQQFKARVRARLPVDAEGHITHAARANAVKGRVPN